MARFTSAYSSFASNLDEVSMLVRLAAEKERADPVRLGREINSLCRGAVVLLSSHLEAYIKDLGEVALESLFSKQVNRTAISSRLYFHISKHFFDDVQGTTDPEKLAEHLFLFIQNDLHFWSKVGPFPNQIPVEKFNKGFSNPAFAKICSYIGRFGYADYKRDLARRLTATYQPVTNMLDQLVITRNKIAHGDPLATKTPADVRLMIQSIQAFARTTDSLFSEWWKINFCTIR
jgi:RiboL-PSP-HEPN